MCRKIPTLFREIGEELDSEKNNRAQIMKTNPYTTTQTCSSAATTLLHLTESLKGWNVLVGLYEEPSNRTETSILGCANEARSILANGAALILLEGFLNLAGREFEARLCHQALMAQSAEVDALSERCSVLMKEAEVENDSTRDLQPLLIPVLEHMAAHGMASITIKNVSGKESR